MTKYIIRIPSAFTSNYLYVLDAIHDSVDAGEVESSAKRFDSMIEAEIFALTHNLGRYRIEPVSEPIRPLFPSTAEPWLEVDFQSIELKSVWPRPWEDFPVYDLGGEG